MTLVDVAKQAEPGKKFKRRSSARMLHFGEGKKRPPYIAVDEYEQSAVFWSDDLTADDWEVL